VRRVPELGPVALVDSHFAFRPVGMNPERAGPRALAAQLLDVLPHPLYTLIAALEAVTPDPSAIELAALVGGPADLQAVIQATDVYGRLSVSLRARPVASTLTVAGAGGALTADFIRSSVVGPDAPREPRVGAPLAVVTGARGFFGREITRALVRRGYRVRGISRSPDTEDPHVHEWHALDLSGAVPQQAFAGATVVVHAAVDTSGGY